MIDFIDLNRRFNKVSDQRNPEEAAQESYLLVHQGLDESLGWQELLQYRAVVILGEPGSGKSTELQHQAIRLGQQSMPAFFARLDRLVNEPLLTVIGEKNTITFKKWKKGHHTAYFFFDSVDESKLRKPDNFQMALDRISDAISLGELQRARLIFSSRISEWRPVTDELEVQRRFLFPTQTLPAQPVNSNITQDKPIVVYLAPLDQDRVRSYAQWRGLSNPEDFIKALDEHHAWEFARRPLDVNGLIEFWKHYGRLGSLTEMIEYSLDIDLRETEGRETTYPLTPESSRQGAEALAAAAILCRNLNFKVPDDAYIPATMALDAANCLPTTWSAAERRALLTRPLFDGAAYGCIRFHHRRILEYLSASWLNRRIGNGCPLDRIDDLLFAQHQGEYILRPALAPVAAWLANGNEPHNRLVRERLLQAAPGVHFRYGDPAQLSIEHKRSVLRALADRYEDRQRVWLEHDPPALARLADPALVSDVSALIIDRHVANSLRQDMLLLVRYGRLTACLETALEIIADPTEDDTIKQYAISTLRDCADIQIRRRLASIVSNIPILTSRLTSLLCETLYPEIIDARGLADLLNRTVPLGHYSSDLPWTLKHIVQERLTPALAASLLGVIIELIHTEPYLDRGREEEPISQRFGWLCKVIPAVLGKLLEDIHLNPENATLAARSIHILETYWIYNGQNEHQEAQILSTVVSRQSAVKREYFWQGVAKYRAVNQRAPEFYAQISGSGAIVTLDTSDAPWLTTDASQGETDANRALALRFAFNLWQPYRMQWRQWLALLGVQFSRPHLIRFVWKYTWHRLTYPIGAFWFRQLQWKLLSKDWWHHKSFRFRRVRRWWKDQYVLHRHLYRLYSGRAVTWLVNLSREAESQSNSPSRWATADWASLRKKRGPIIAGATRHGCEVSWVRYLPQLPHEKTNPNETSYGTIVGLCGLQSLWRKGKINFTTFSDQAAERAARYALNEMNGFSDWFSELAHDQPQVVRRILQSCIQGEWRYPPEGEHVHEVLSKLQSQGEHFLPLIAEDLLEQLQGQDPQHPRILDYTLSILLKGSDPPLSELAALAAQRTARHPTDSPFFSTWMVLWLQIEATGALDHLVQYLHSLPAAQADDFMQHLCSALRGDRLHSRPYLTQPDYLRPQTMRLLVPLVYRHIRPGDDVDRSNGEAYSPTDRDDAQDFRDGLLQRLAQLDDPSVLTTLRDLYDEPDLVAYRDWIAHLIDQHISQIVDLLPWLASDIRTFTAEYETDPRNDSDLFRIACWRMLDIKHEVEQTENSLREEVQVGWDEPALRRWFQRKLNERSRQRYSVPQEAEIDQQQRPDLHFENPGIRAAVPVEIKWAENWTARTLLERLENQLVGQYLRAHNIRYGIYLLGYIGLQQEWEHPSERRRINFNELALLITQRAQEIERERPDVAGIRVITIDFTTP